MKGPLRYRYYVCTNAQKTGWDNCPSKTVPATQIESFVVERIRAIGQDPQVVAKTLAQVSAQAGERFEELEREQRLIEREVRDTQGQVKQMLLSAGEDWGGSASRTDRLADLNERIRHREKRLAEIRTEYRELEHSQIDEQDLRRALERFDPVWEALAPHERIRLVHPLFEWVGYDGRNETVSITFHPSGIKALANQDEKGPWSDKR